MLNKRTNGKITLFIFSYYKIIILISTLVVIIGAYSIPGIPVTLLPAHTEHVVTIVTYYPDTESNRMVDMVTKPLEKALKSVRGVKDIYSFSSRGKSKIVCYFNTKEDVDEFIVRLTDRIYQVKRAFPREVHSPLVYRYNTDDSAIMIGSVSFSFDQEIDNKAMSYFVYERLKPALLSVEGVANVQVSGLDRYEYLVGFNYEAIKTSKMDYLYLLKQLVKNNYNRAIGSFITDNEEVSIKLSGRYKSIQKIENSRIRYKTNSISTEDLFKVSKVKKPDNRFSMVNDKRAVLVYIYKKSGASVLKIERSIKAKLKSYSGNFSWQRLYSEAEDLNMLLKRVAVSVAASLLLIALFLLILYRRKMILAALIFTPTIVSIMGSIIAIFIIGKGLNITGVSALIIGTGMSIVMGIIIIENFLRQCNIFLDKNPDIKNQALPEPILKDERTVKRRVSLNYNALPILSVLIEETLKKSIKPIFMTVISESLMFLPIFFFGRELNTKLWIAPYKDFQIILFFISIWSLISVMFLLPSLIVMLKDLVIKAIIVDYHVNNYRKNSRHEQKNWLLKLLGFSKLRLLNFCKRFSFNKKIASRLRKSVKSIKAGFIYLLMGLLLFFIFTVSLYLFLHIDRGELIQVKKSEYPFYYQFNGGYNKKYRVKATSQIVETLLGAIKEENGALIRSVTGGNDSFARGNSFTLTSTLEGDRIRFYLLSGRKSHMLLPYKGALQKTGDKSFDAKTDFILRLTENSGRKDGFFYSNSRQNSAMIPVRVLIFGEDLKRLNKLSDLSSKKIYLIPGVTQILKGYREGVKEFAIEPDISSLNFHGLNNSSVERFLRYLFYRPVILKFYNGKTIQDVRAGFNIDSYGVKSAGDFIGNIQVPLKNGRGFVKVSDFAQVVNQKSPSEISRKNGKPYISLDIRCLNNKRYVVFPSIDSVMKRQHYRLDEYYTIDDESKNSVKGNAVFLLSLLMSIFLMWLAMSFVLQSFKRSLYALGPVPTGFSGVMIFLMISGYKVSLSSEIASAFITSLSAVYGFLIINELFSISIRANGKRVVMANINQSILSLARILMINFVVFLLLMFPVFIFVGESKFFRVLTGGILFSVAFLLIFLLANFFFLCIIKISIIIKKT